METLGIYKPCKFLTQDGHCTFGIEGLNSKPGNRGENGVKYSKTCWPFFENNPLPLGIEIPAELQRTISLAQLKQCEKFAFDLSGHSVPLEYACLKSFPFGQLRSGISILGINTIEGLNALHHSIANYLRRERLQREDGSERFFRITSDFTDRPGNYLLPYLDRKGFYGKTGAIDVKIISPDYRFVPKGDEIIPELGFSYLFGIELFSTGRGSIGQSWHECTMAYRRYMYKNNPHLLRSYFRDLGKNSGTAVIDNLRNDATSEWYLSQLDALSKVFQAGLPTLGRR